ncbi:MAG: hypothetical protein KAV82_01930 [Phycisphaerae bacterium]|nr:hypothetical protein [Phycisphaerae bacterium]
MVSSSELSLCTYVPSVKGRSRQIGSRVHDNGTVTPELHFYDTELPIMLTLDDSGNMSIGMSNDPSGELPLGRYNFFEAWPSNSKRMLGFEDNVIPVYGEKGTILGTITPDGVFTLFQYDNYAMGEEANVESIIQMNQLPTPGDFDGDGDVDLADYAVFADCMAGPGAAPSPASVTAQQCLGTFDFDIDLDVDLEDFASFNLGFAQ